jgi:hypothetical protein
MAASTASSALISAPAQCLSTADRRTNRRRRIGTQAGRALEILGHAIEYLSDEYVNEHGAAFSARNEKVEAMQLLMALNRQVYFECPYVPTFGERCGSLLRACFG